MADMADQENPVVVEVRYWLDRDEYGLLSAVARRTGVTPTSVSSWATGATQPSERHWPALEEMFGQKAGHLRRIAGGEIQPLTTPIEVTVPRPGSDARVGRVVDVVTRSEFEAAVRLLDERIRAVVHAGRNMAQLRELEATWSAIADANDDERSAPASR